MAKCNVGDGDYARKSRFLEAVIISCQAAMDYAARYAELAQQMAEKCTDPDRKQELLAIAEQLQQGACQRRRKLLSRPVSLSGLYSF